MSITVVVSIKSKCVCQQFLVTRHDVRQVCEGLCCMPVGTDVNVNPTLSFVVTLCASFTKGSYEALECTHIIVGKDWSHQFALLWFRAVYTDVSLEFPFPSILRPCAPASIPIPECRVFIPSSSEELCRNLSRFLAGDVVHLHLDPNRLFLRFIHVYHVLALLCSFVVYIYHSDQR